MRVFRLRNFLTLLATVFIVLSIDWYVHDVPIRQRKRIAIRREWFEQDTNDDNQEFVFIEKQAPASSFKKSTILVILLENPTPRPSPPEIEEEKKKEPKILIEEPRTTSTILQTSTTTTATTMMPSKTTINTSFSTLLPTDSQFKLTTLKPTAPRLIPRTMCPDPAPDLKGPINGTFDAPPIEDITAANPDVMPGGKFRPNDCVSIHGRVAIIVPYRDRMRHLKAFLNHMHPILQRQQLNYVIIVAEQAGNGTFNKALLMNAAYNESLQLIESNDLDSQFQCYIFHDIDLLTEDDRGIYTCRDKPTHFSEYLSHLNYEPYKYIDVLFGGVVAIPRRHFELVNGYSNTYFGWGAEDEDIRRRFRYSRIPILKVEKDKYRYKMVTHPPDRGNPRNSKRVQLLRNATSRMQHDGLSSLTYKLLKREYLPLYTHLLIEINEDDVLNASL